MQVEALDSHAAELAVRKMEHEMHAAQATAMRRAREEAVAVRISGATGRYAGWVNGLFELTGESSNGPVWKMRGAGWYLYRTHNGEWFVGDAEDKDAQEAIGFAHSEELGPGSLPTDACSEWKVWCGGEWGTQALQVCCSFLGLVGVCMAVWCRSRH